MLHAITLYRLYETLQLGSIPIYIWEGQQWLPFQELIDWSDISVTISAHLMRHGGLVRKIGSVQTKVPEMLQNIISMRHMFTYNYTVAYIAQWLRRHNTA